MIYNHLDVPRAIAEQNPRASSRGNIVLRPIGPSIGAEIAIQRAVTGILKQAAQMVREHGMPIAASLKRELTVDAELVQDDTASLQRFNQQFRNFLDMRFGGLAPQVANTLWREELKHRSAFEAAIKSTAGLDVKSIMRSNDVRPFVESAVLEQVNLIKGMSDELAKRVSSTILEAGRTGLTQRQLANRLSKQFGWSTDRAKLIARDQLATFNGNLNRVRQIQMGIDRYIWHTALDERVRPEHARREGLKYRWNKPPADGHPGEPINCRCVARALIFAADEVPSRSRR